MANEDASTQPTAPSTRSSCLKTAGITCLVVLILGTAVVLWGFKQLLKNPAFNKAFSAGRSMSQCQMNLQNPGSGQDISDALERYAKRNGRYPAGLAELYPNFLENKAVLHCPADSRPADTVSYDYRPPDVNAPPTTVVVECRRHTILEGQPPWVIFLRKDGKVLKEGYKPRSGPPEPRAKD